MDCRLNLANNTTIKLMEKNNMTAVEWLVEQLKERGYSGQFPPHLLFDQAKQMEKEQQKYFFECGRNFQLTAEGTFEQYYNETYGKD
jgi:hypothetical protein